jgi:hypothetical protein
VRDIQSIGESPRPVPSWIRRNVINAAPLWIQLYRSALANVRIRLGAAMTVTPTALSTSGRHIQTLFALLALDRDEPARQAAPTFTSVPANHSPGLDWPSDQW